MTSEPQLRIKSVATYPIKSLRGCTLPSLVASATGFSYDRRFMIQRVSDEKHMSIGKVFEMCLFTTELVPAANPSKIVVRYTLGHVVGKPEEAVDDEPLEIPLEPDWKADGLKERLVTMHNSPTYGYEMAGKYDEWLSRRFGYAVRLIYVGENRRKVLGSVSPDVAKLNQTQQQGWLGAAKASIGSLVGSVVGQANDEEESQGVDQGIAWADVAPFLIVSQKSYENAAARISNADDLDIFKFRPNIIIEGADEEFDEDFWAEISIGDADTRIVLTSNCARCASINVDHETGNQGDGEAGKILKLLQKDRRVDPGMKYSPIFGRYGFLARRGKVKDEGEVEIKVGDVVRIVRRQKERDRFQWPGLSTDR